MELEEEEAQVRVMLGGSSRSYQASLMHEKKDDSAILVILDGDRKEADEVEAFQGFENFS